MSNVGTCATCKHWAVNVRATPGDGVCKRYPPTLIPLVRPEGIQLTSHFPPCKSSEGCGEYVLDLRVPVDGEQSKQ